MGFGRNINITCAAERAVEQYRHRGGAWWEECYRLEL